MARNRMVKADFWVSEQIVSCSRDARLLFIGLWCFCDDAGITPASYLRLKMEVFPGDDCTTDSIKRLVDELIHAGLVREYAIEEKLYWIVTGWSRHQKIDRPTYRYPKPQSELKVSPTDLNQLIPVNISASSRRGIDDCSGTPQLELATKEKKRNGKEKKKDIREVKTSPSCSSESNLLASTQEIFQHWQSVMNHPMAKLDKNRQRKIVQALGAGYSVLDLKQAIDGCVNTPHNMGKNEEGQKYDDITLILRDATHIERFMNNCNANSGPNSTDDLMAGVI